MTTRSINKTYMAAFEQHPTDDWCNLLYRSHPQPAGFQQASW